MSVGLSASPHSSLSSMSRRRHLTRRYKSGSLRVSGLLVASINLLAVSAQYTSSKCTSNSTTAWIFNEAGESPCTVWSKLQYLCLQSVVNVPALEDSSWSYNAPAGELATQCSCNDVAFNLMAACAWCQVGQQPVDPGIWKSTCGGSYQTEGLGFSESQVAIPAFAWAAAKAGTWDPASASAAAASFTAYPTTTYSSTISRVFPTDVATATASKTSGKSSSMSSTATASASGGSGEAQSSTEGEGEEEGKKSNVGAIIGGVAGGLVALVAIAILVLKFMRRRDPEGSTRSVSSPQPQKSDNHNLHKSFIDGFGHDARQSYSSDDTERGEKAQRLRNTELFNLPDSFAEPRPAPPAPAKKMSRFMSGLSRASMPVRVRSGYIKTSDKGAGTFDAPPGMEGRRLTPSNGSHLSNLPPPPGMRGNHISYGFTPSPTERAGPGRETLNDDRMTAWTEDEDYYSDDYSIASGQPGKGPRTTRTLPSLYDPGTAGVARTSMATDSMYSKYVTNPDPEDDIPPVPRR